MTAAKEANQDFANDIADLRTAQTRTGGSVQSNNLADSWFVVPAPTNEPPHWDVARQLFGQGKAGNLVPSFELGGDEIPPHQVRASDPSTRVPKDL